MASSTLDLPVNSGTQDSRPTTGTLGPSDTSDSGSDLLGTAERSHTPGAHINSTGRALGDADLDGNSDSGGTGERQAAGDDADAAVAADIDVDRIAASGDDLGLGGGLDQAEEAQLGVTDEELEPQELDALLEQPDSTPSAAAGGVDEDELLDQLHSSSPSEEDADPDANKAEQDLEHTS